jgi:hypothetical protein
VEHTTNWKPDPFGTHELRFFSADGRPTLLVMDGGKRSYDKPPVDQSERPGTRDQVNSDPSMPEPPVSNAAHPPPASSAAPTPDRTPLSTPHEIGGAQVSVSAVAPTSDATERHPQDADPIPMSAELFDTSAVDRPLSGTGYHEPETMSGPLKIAYAIVFGVLALSVLGLAYVHLLHHSGDGHSTGAASPTTTTLAHMTTTTAVVLPSTLSPSAEGAAAALVSSWSTNNRAAALTVATPTAVATILAVPYASGLAIARGCSTSFSPIVCTYGPPGGASPTDPIYQIKVSQVSGGWYVSSVKIEN